MLIEFLYFAHIPQSSSTAGTSTLDCLVSYPGHSLGGGSYPSAEVQLVYSTAPAVWANTLMEHTAHEIALYIFDTNGIIYYTFHIIHL